MMEKKRSVGVIVIGIIMLVYSFPLFFSQSFNIITGGCYTEMQWGGPDFFPFFDVGGASSNQIIYVIFLRYLMGVIYLVSSIGILKLKNWCRLLSVYFSIAIVLVYALEAIYGLWLVKSFADHIGEVIFLWVRVIPFAMQSRLYLLPILLFLFYFTRPRVREQFK